MHIDPTLYTGRPQNLEGRLPREVACYDLLDRLAIPYTRVDLIRRIPLQPAMRLRRSWALPSVRIWCCAIGRKPPSIFS